MDFVLLAGDTFHQNQPSLYIQNIFCQALQRLEKEGIEVVMCFGNHDYYTPQRYWFDFPENVHLFTEEAVSTLTLTTKSNERVAFSGFSYCQPWIEARKDIEFPYKAVDCDYHIGLYHGQQAGKYAPFQISELVSKGYDYWALGHIHVPTTLNEQPAIVYPGTPQGHTKKEINQQWQAINHEQKKLEENNKLLGHDWQRGIVKFEELKNYAKNSYTTLK